MRYSVCVCVCVAVMVVVKIASELKGCVTRLVVDYA